MLWLHESGPFQGSYRQPRETTQHLLGPIWVTFRPTKFKFHYVGPQFGGPSKLHQISFTEIRTYFSFGLILRDIPNSIIPQTTLRLLPIPVGLLVLPCTRQCRWSTLYSPPPPSFFSCPGQRNQWKPVPVPVTGVCTNSLLWMCMLNTLAWPDSDPKCLALVQLVLVYQQSILDLMTTASDFYT